MRDTRWRTICIDKGAREKANGTFYLRVMNVRASWNGSHGTPSFAEPTPESNGVVHPCRAQLFNKTRQHCRRLGLPQAYPRSNGGRGIAHRNVLLLATSLKRLNHNPRPAEERPARWLGSQLAHAGNTITTSGLRLPDGVPLHPYLQRPVRAKRVADFLAGQVVEGVVRQVERHQATVEAKGSTDRGRALLPEVVPGQVELFQSHVAC